MRDPQDWLARRFCDARPSTAGQAELGSHVRSARLYFCSAAEERRTQAHSGLIPRFCARPARSRRRRSPLAPDVPTAKEAGYPDLTFSGVVGFYGWRDIPAELRERIAADVRAVGSDPAIGARIASLGSVVRVGTPAEFAAAIEEQRVKIAAIHQTIIKQTQ
ncbi:MAG: hypothetical protein E6G86_17315 [Alphaproteobacteria bacterium]|nr:MAG: hypothetical protein E6G86_17315 [Alphaproteobacteria bacterium]